MKTPVSFYATEEFEIRNTGLRPNWDSFWALEITENENTSLSCRNPTPSFFSYKSVQSGGTLGCVKHVKFVTGSEWIGEWDSTGMTGTGMYKMPHGVIYEGTMKAGLFEGIGILKYPNGSCLEGLWHQGNLQYWQFGYADGFERDSHYWTYCTMPDRRFYSEHQYGFRPANAEQVSNHQPAREVPPGHYDVGLGFYNPKSHCVVDAVTGEVLSIPTADEEKWILKRCRTAEPIETVGFRPDLYDNLFKQLPEQRTSVEDKSEDSEKEPYGGVFSKVGSELSKVERGHWNREDLKCRPTEKEYAIQEKEKEMLSLIQQEGAKLHPINALNTHHNRVSLYDKLEVKKTSEINQELIRVASFEGLIRRIMKEIELNVESRKTSEDSNKKHKTNSSESDLLRLTQIINAYTETTRKKTTSPVSSAGSCSPSEQFKVLGKFFPSVSLSQVFLGRSSTRGSPNILEMGQVATFMPDRVLKNDKSEESMLNTTNYEK